MFLPGLADQVVLADSLVDAWVSVTPYSEMVA